MQLSRQIDLPFDEMVSALASLPMPTSSAEDIDSWVLPVGQLILGLRPGEGNISTHHEYSSFRAWWESLERVGLRPFAVHDREDEVLEVRTICHALCGQLLTCTLSTLS